MPTVLWTRELPYRSTTVRVGRLLGGWRLTLAGTRTVERRTLVEAFEDLLGRNAGREELAVMLTVLTSISSALGNAAGDAPSDHDAEAMTSSAGIRADEG